MKKMISAKQFGRLIKETRRDMHLTQRELAAACGTGVRFIQDLEKGKLTCELGKSLLVAKMLGIQVYGIQPRLEQHD
jgi:HTH-type transcriptional regulator/antitoxin HipB